MIRRLIKKNNEINKNAAERRHYATKADKQRKHDI